MAIGKLQIHNSTIINDNERRWKLRRCDMWCVLCMCKCHVDYCQNGVRCRWMPSVVVMYLSFWINYNLAFTQLMADVRIRHGSTFAYKMRDARHNTFTLVQTQCANKELIAVKPSTRRTFLVSISFSFAFHRLNFSQQNKKIYTMFFIYDLCAWICCAHFDLAIA